LGPTRPPSPNQESDHESSETSTPEP
jgi:hypothetical protein